MLYQSETGRLQRVIVKPAVHAFVSQAMLDRQWRPLHYYGCPDFGQACRESDAFAGLLQSLGVEVVSLPVRSGLSIDSLYCRDASFLCEEGAILGSMGKAARQGEPEALEELYQSLGIPILGRIDGKGRLEGGDVAWVDQHTLAVGRGYRTNEEGIRQLQALARGRFEVVVAPLPHFRGPEDVFHLMSVFSPVAEDLAVVYSPLMPVPFRELLIDRGYRLVEVPEQEFDSMGCNVLAVGPRECIMLEGNPVTQQRLEAAGARVHTYQGAEISVKGAGGPTCLTRPLERGGHEGS